MEGMNTPDNPDDDYIEYDYITLDESGYRIYGFDIDFDNDGELDHILFDSPLLVCPSDVREGRTYYGEAEFTFNSIPYRFSTAVTIYGISDVTLDSGVVFNDALKVTRETTIEDLAERGFYVSATRTHWLVRGLGSVKSVETDDAEDAETYNLLTATTFYESGNIKARFLDRSTNPEYVYIEYADEDFNGRGYGRVTRAQKTDGSYVVVSEYWPDAEDVKFAEFHGADGGLLYKAEYLKSGAIAAIYQDSSSSVDDEQASLLYSAARPYIKYYLDRSLTADPDPAINFEGLTRSYQLYLGSGDPAAAITSTAYAYDQAILGLLQLYDGTTTILDTYISHYKRVMNGDSANALIHSDGTYHDLAGNDLNSGLHQAVRILNRGDADWWTDWNWGVDTGAAAMFIVIRKRGVRSYRRRGL